MIIATTPKTDHTAIAGLRRFFAYMRGCSIEKAPDFLNESLGLITSDSP
jgi:hypothetical protein